MKLTSQTGAGAQVFPEGETESGQRFIRLLPPDLRAVDGDPEGPMPVVDVWFDENEVLQGRICWASAAKGNTDRLRDFEDPEQYAPGLTDEK